MIYKIPALLIFTSPPHRKQRLSLVHWSLITCHAKCCHDAQCCHGEWRSLWWHCTCHMIPHCSCHIDACHFDVMVCDACACHINVTTLRSLWCHSYIISYQTIENWSNHWKLSHCDVTVMPCWCRVDVTVIKVTMMLHWCHSDICHCDVIIMW